MDFIKRYFGADFPRAVLFDLDGTLVDSAPDLAVAMDTVLTRLALPVVCLRMRSQNFEHELRQVQGKVSRPTCRMSILSEMRVVLQYISSLRTPRGARREGAGLEIEAHTLRAAGLHRAGGL